MVGIESRLNREATRRKERLIFTDRSGFWVHKENEIDQVRKFSKAIRMINERKKVSENPIDDRLLDIMSEFKASS